MTKPKNKRYNKADEVYRKLEAILLECQKFSDTSEYKDIIDSISRAMKEVTNLKIKFIKKENNKIND